MKYVLLPHVVIKQHDDLVYVGNDVAGVHLECSAGVRDVIDTLRTPKSVADLAAQYKAPEAAVRELLAPLIEAVMIVPEPFVDALGFGPTHKPPEPIGRHLPIDHLDRDAVPGSFVMIGAPTDVGAGMEGRPSHGPSLIRGAFPNPLPVSGDDEWYQRWGVDPRRTGLVQDLELRRQYDPEDLPRVRDIGDVPYESGESLTRYGSRLEFVVSRVLDAGMRPFTLGGDHSVTRFAIAALQRRHPAFGIIHFDAHHDLYKGFPPRPLSHANPFAYLIREEQVKVLYQVGLRAGFEHMDHLFRPVIEPKLGFVSALECQSLTPEEVFANLPRDLPYYLSFDIDVLDPVYAPETGTPVLGGLTYYQALRFVDYVARTFDLIGADVVEVAATHRRANYAARIAARLTAQILLERTKFTRLESYVFERA